MKDAASDTPLLDRFRKFRTDDTFKQRLSSEQLLMQSSYFSGASHMYLIVKGILESDQTREEKETQLSSLILQICAGFDEVIQSPITHH